MSDPVGRLKIRVAQLERDNAALAYQVAEANLKLLYVMRHFKMQRQPKPGALVDAVGKPVAEDRTIYTLADVFEMDRERFTQSLIAEHQEHARAQAIQQQADHGNGAGAGAGTGTGAGSGQGRDPIPFLAPGADADAAAIADVAAGDTPETSPGARRRRTLH